MALEVNTRQDSDVGILEVSGYISDPEAERIAEVGAALIAGGTRRILLDLKGTDIANSMGISILIELIEKVRELGGRTAFCNVKPILAKTFGIMGLLKVAELYDSDAEAVSALKG